MIPAPNRASERYRIREGGPWSSSKSDGLNGAYRIQVAAAGVFLVCVVEDGQATGWEHVTVTVSQRWMGSYRLAGRAPNQSEMATVRRLFFLPSETVLELWPPELGFRNLHPDTRHLWRRLKHWNHVGALPSPDLWRPRLHELERKLAVAR